MRIRSYKGRNTSEALEMVRNDMGPSALIIQTKRVTQGGLFGLLGREAVEVVAATDDDRPGPRRVGPSTADTPPGHPQSKTSTLKQLYEDLVKQGVLPPLARKLVEEALCRIPSSPFASRFPNFAQRLEATPATGDIADAMQAAVANTVRLKPPHRPARAPKVIALVGPTGVGKTTTIAKLATIAAVRHQVPAGLVTIDTYRIGAVDQLKMYSEMIGVPLAVVQQPEEMRSAMEHFSDKKVVFVDTIGRSPKDPDRVDALKPYFRYLPEAETHLVVSASATYGDAKLAAETFSALEPSRLIFSKIDESTSFGSIYNLAAETQIPLSYITAGQEVPDDIEVTTPARIAELLMGGPARGRVKRISEKS